MRTPTSASSTATIQRNILPAGASLEALRKYRRDLYAAGTITGRTGKVTPLFPTGVTEFAGEFLRDMIIAEAPTHTLEVGLGLGLSSLFFAEARYAIGETVANHSHTIIEPFASYADFAGVENLARAGVLPQVVLIHDDSTRALPRLLDQGAKQRFDLAFIDGSHLFDYVFVDLFYTLQLVRPGGLIILDDLWMPAVRAAIAFFAKNLEVQTTVPDPTGPARRYLTLRVPAKPSNRAWDHFAEFAASDVYCA